MNAPGVFKTLICGIVAVGVTAGVYFFDHHRSQVQEVSAGLRWARQIATQVETLEMTAREKGEENPLNWAIDFLAQGTEPRLIRVSRIAPEAATRQQDEVFDLDRKSGIFDYSKILDQEKSTGIRVQIDVGASGLLSEFLGTRSPFMHDFALGAIFALSFLSLLGLTLVFGRANGKPEESKETEEFERIETEPVLVELKINPAEPWLHEEKRAFTELSSDVRDLIKQATVMTKASSESYQSVAALRGRIHSGLTEIHETRASLKQSVQMLAEAEILACAPITADAAAQLGELLARLREIAIQHETAVGKAEMQIEPCATDADVAFAAHEDVIGTAKEMNAQIDKTKQSLVAQAQLIKDLETKLGHEEPKVVPPPAPAALAS